MRWRHPKRHVDGLFSSLALAYYAGLRKSVKDAVAKNAVVGEPIPNKNDWGRTVCGKKMQHMSMINM